MRRRLCPSSALDLQKEQHLFGGAGEQAMPCHSMRKIGSAAGRFDNSSSFERITHCDRQSFGSILLTCRRTAQQRWNIPSRTSKSRSLTYIRLEACCDKMVARETPQKLHHAKSRHPKHGKARKKDGIPSLDSPWNQASQARLSRSLVGQAVEATQASSHQKSVCLRWL